MKIVDVITTVAVGVDLLDSSELGIHMIATVVTQILIALGQSEVDAYAAGAWQSKALEDNFRKEYWKDNKTSTKVKTIMAAVMTAEAFIKEGRIDENLRKITQEAIDTRKRASA